ncbi:MAG: hypothetical protein WA876_06325 [Candidatus Acidiferrales bacterium]
MDPTRRVFLTAFVPGVALAGASFLTGTSVLARSGQDSAQLPNQMQHPTPNPANERVVPVPPSPPSKAQLRQNERDLRKDVDQLFSLAQDLKSLAAKSDASEELSVGLIQKTEEIEKLAKKIRDLARS